MDGSCRWQLGCLFWVLLITWSGSASLAAAPVDIEATLQAGSTENLFADSTSRFDAFGTTSTEIDYTPLPFAKLTLSGEYNYYREATRLSNFRYGGEVTVIPLSDSSRFSIYLNAAYRDREYREREADTSGINANEFSGAESDAILSVGFDAGLGWRTRAGLTYSSQAYQIQHVIDRRSVKVFAGFNRSFWNRLALDVESGYGGGRFQRVNPYVFVFDEYRLRPPIGPDSAYSILLEDDLRSAYVSVRFSGSPGLKTGLAVTLARSWFTDSYDDIIIYGYSTGYLSPWVSEYEGSSISFSLKSHLVPRLVVTARLGYWDRSYLPMVERTVRERLGQQTTEVNVRTADFRTDYRWRLSLVLQLPLGHSIRGTFIEPRLELGYTDNNSTSLVYDYDDFQLTAGLTVRF